MQENNGKTRNIVDMITEKDNTEYIYRIKVYEDHSSESFKNMNKEFIKAINNYNNMNGQDLIIYYDKNIVMNKMQYK